MIQPITWTPVKAEAPTRDDTSDADDNSPIQMTEPNGAKENEAVTRAHRRRQNAALRSRIHSKVNASRDFSKLIVPELKQARFNSGSVFRIRPATTAHRAEADRLSTAVT